MDWIIFTDLDGTLLDHHTYSAEPARPALDRIRDEGWPLVIVTSKTRAEVEPLRDSLELDTPFVVENGGGVFFPDTPEWAHVGEPFLHHGAETGLRAVVLGLPYARARGFVAEEGRALGMTGFGDLSDQGAAELTGLPLEDAARARTRDFTEPFLLDDEARLPEVRQAARAHGLAITTGGRFHHLIGAGQDKGRAVEIVRDAYRAGVDAGREADTIGLGDGANDVPMLMAVDRPVLIPSPTRPLPRVPRDDVRIAPEPGPAGWAAVLLDIFDAGR